MANLIVNPANLVGKLHQAAVDSLNNKDGYKGKIEIFNTAVNVSDSKKPLAVVKDGEYKLICKLLDKEYFENVDDLRAPIGRYLEVFAGSDIAKAFSKNTEIDDFIKKQFDKKQDQIEIPYEIQVKSGAKQPETTIISQQKSDANQEEIIDLGDVSASDSSSSSEAPKLDNQTNTSLINSLATTSDVNDSNPVATAAKKTDYLSNEGNAKKFIDSVSDLSKDSKDMTEEKMLLILSALKNFKDTYKEADEDVKEESVINEDSIASTADALYSKYSKYLNASLTGLSNTAKSKKFKLKDLIKRMSDVKTGETKSFWKRLADFSPNVLRQFAKEVYRWSENAIRKAKQDFKANFVVKTEDDKAKEEKDSEAETEQLKDKNALKEKIKNLKEFPVRQNGSELVNVPVTRIESDIKKINAEIEKTNKVLKTKRKKLEKVLKKASAAQASLLDSTFRKTAQLAKTWTLKEIVNNAGVKTLKKFFDLSNGEYYSDNGKTSNNIFDLGKDLNSNAFKTLLKNIPQELYGWIPEKVRDIMAKDESIKRFAGMLRSEGLDVSESILAASLLKSNIANESVITFTFDPVLQYSIVKTNLLKEHKEKMNRLSNTLVKQIASEKNYKAQKTLEKILKEKVSKRIKDVLEEEK